MQARDTMEKQKIERINQLAKLSRERELTREERQEQAALREEYISAVRSNLSSQLDNTYIVSEDGEKEKLQKKPLN